MCRYCVALEAPNRKRALGEKGKFWPNGEAIGVQWMGGTEAQRDLVVKYAIEWSEYANIDFIFGVSKGEIRVSFNEGDGSWSYVGTDAKSIPLGRATMNFGWLDKAVVLHEFGHALGLGHEHQNPIGGIKWNLDAVIGELSKAPNFWDLNTIMWNVIEPYEAAKIIGTNLDSDSIMMYSIPKEWTLNGFETGFNNELSDLDKQFIQSVYPSKIDEEIEEKIGDLQTHLQYIFKARKDLNRLSEGTVCRIGDLINAESNQRRYRKSKNVDLVWEKIIN